MVDGNERPERTLAVFVDERQELVGGLVELACAVGLHFKQRAKAVETGAGDEFLRRDAEVLEVFLRDINAAERAVFLDVAEDVGELESNADFFGELLGKTF